MNSCLAYDIIKKSLMQNKFDVITECAAILYPNERKVFVEEYTGSGMRVFNKKDGVHVFCPKEYGICESDYLANAISTGSIFDDADTVDRASEYITKTTMPCDTMIRQGLEPPIERMKPVVGLAIGCVGHDGLECDENNLRNGYVIMKDVISGGSSGNDIRDIISNNIGVEDPWSLPKTVAEDLYSLKSDLKKLNDFDENDLLPDDDLVESEDVVEEIIDHSENNYQEGFLSKKPKHLKVIPMRDIVSYITTQKNAIVDVNDQSMLSGYTCSKLDVCDFYISCIDTNDSRYIVPHDRASLVRYQNDLNRLLTEILKLKPMNKQDRVWKIDVNYPAGWRG